MMKNFIILTALLLMSTFSIAQYKKDGTPDMRFRQNRQVYGNDFYTPNQTSTDPTIIYQRGYERNGTYVEPSYHTRPNNTNWDNWSTNGNINPLTNSRGSRARDYSYDASNYGQGQTIQIGPRSGQYYQNSNGNRIYVPKQSY